MVASLAVILARGGGVVPDERTLTSRKHVAGLVMGALGLLVGVCSVTWPFGSDQGLYHYIAREWLRHGDLPYVDTFDHKTPGIYIVNAIVIALFGERTWPLRVVEWLAMVPLGLAFAAIATPRREHTPSWLKGFGVLAANVVYFGYFDWWATAQCEIYCVLASVFALWIATRAPWRLTTAAILVGVLTGTAIMMKPPSVFLSLVAVFALLRRDRSAKTLAALAAACVLVFGAVAAWFAAHHALGRAFDCVVNVNRAFAVAERAPGTVPQVLRRIVTADSERDPLRWLLHVGPVVAFVFMRKNREVFGYAAALVLAATLGVGSQLKLYGYHWGLLVAGEGLAATAFAFALVRACEKRFWWAYLAPSCLLAALFASSGGPFRGWLDEEKWLAAYAASGDRKAYADHFNFDAWGYHHTDVEEVGRWLRDHADSNDRVLARGYAPEIYLSSGLSYGGRFFWDPPLMGEGREAWRAEDSDALAQISPRWVVAIRHYDGLPPWIGTVDIEKPSWFESRGYCEVFAQRQFVVMERQGEDPPSATADGPGLIEPCRRSRR